MASTFSPLLGIELIGTGDQSGTWGLTTNTNLGTLIEDAIAGTATVDVTSSDVILSVFNGTADESRCAAVKVFGTPGTPRTVTAPAKSKLYVVANNSDDVVVFKTATSTGVSLDPNDVTLLYYDTTSGIADFRIVGQSARSTNTPNTVVLRDGSGNFAAGMIYANLTGNVTGDLTGDVVGNVAGTFNGTVGNFVPGAGTFSSLSAEEDITLGTSALDTLTVNATPDFNVAIPITSGGTGTTTATGTGSLVLDTAPVISSPALTGTPTTTTAATSDNSTRIASTAYVVSKIAASTAGVTTFSAGTTGLTPSTPTDSNVTLGGTLNIANGGTGQTTASTAINALLPTQTGYNNYYLRTNGSSAFWDAVIQGGVTSVTGTSNQVIVSSSTGAVTFSLPQGIGTSSAVQFGTITGSTLRSTGDIVAYYSSDRNLKQNIVPIANALDIVQKLNGVRYNWTQEYIDANGGEDDFFMRRSDVGVIAQDVEAVLPEIVATNKAGNKAVKYERLVAVLIEAVKELKAEIDELKAK